EPVVRFGERGMAGALDERVDEVVHRLRIARVQPYEHLDDLVAVQLGDIVDDAGLARPVSDERAGDNSHGERSIGDAVLRGGGHDRRGDLGQSVGFDAVGVDDRIGGDVVDYGAVEADDPAEVGDLLGDRGEPADRPAGDGNEGD